MKESIRELLNRKQKFFSARLKVANEFRESKKPAARLSLALRKFRLQAFKNAEPPVSDEIENAEPPECGEPDTPLKP